MTERPEGLSLFEGVEQSGLSFEELWLRQVSVGGDAASIEVEAYVLGLLAPDAHQHNVIAQALNEHSMEHGGDHPVAYVDRRFDI